MRPRNPQQNPYQQCKVAFILRTKTFRKSSPCILYFQVFVYHENTKRTAHTKRKIKILYFQRATNKYRMIVAIASLSQISFHTVRQCEKPI